MNPKAKAFQSICLVIVALFIHTKIYAAHETRANNFHPRRFTTGLMLIRDTEKEALRMSERKK